MLICKDCKESGCPDRDSVRPSCSDFRAEDVEVLIVEPSMDKRIDDLFQVVDGLVYLVGRMERRWDKVMAAIVREANE